MATGRTSHIANMAADLQGLGVSGLRGPRPKTEFHIVFTSDPDSLELHERHAGIDIPLMSAPSLSLCLEGEAEMRMIRQFEDLAELPEVHRWSSRCLHGSSNGDDDVWLHDWLAGLMDDCAAVDLAVRQALIKSISETLLEDIEEEIARAINEIAERRYVEA